MRATSVRALTLLGALCLALLGGVGAPGGQPATAPPVAVAVRGVAITVADAERSARFYAEVLSFDKIADVEVAGSDFERLVGVAGARARVVTMRLGDERIELVEYLTPRGCPIPAGSRSHDRWFQHVAIIVRDMDLAYARLRRHHVRHVSPGPQRLPDWNPGAGGIRAFYFQDPDGHPLEILQFPPDKGDRRWHRDGADLFLGIDHTAIVVADTGASLRFYRDVLGLRVVGTGENWGPEQERLNDVPGARLRITTLRAAAGPGIELLEYLAPRDGRARPADIAANDLVHWQTVVEAPDLPRAAATLRAAGAPLVSADIVAGDGRPGRSRGLGAADPDGHAVLLRGQ